MQKRDLKIGFNGMSYYVWVFDEYDYVMGGQHYHPVYDPTMNVWILDGDYYSLTHIARMCNISADEQIMLALTYGT